MTKGHESLNRHPSRPFEKGEFHMLAAMTVAVINCLPVLIPTTVPTVLPWLITVLGAPFGL